MATFEKYTKKNGETLWKFQTYLGIDQITGKQKRTTRRNFKTKKEAMLASSRLAIEINERGFNGPKQVSSTFEEVYDLWLKQYELTVKESTFHKTVRIFENHIIPELGDMNIQHIKVMHCQKAVNKWFKTVKNFKLLNNYTIKIFDYAISLSFATDNPAKKVTLPVRKSEIIDDDEAIDNFYDKDELVRFFSVMEHESIRTCSSKWYTLFRLLAYSGARKGEVLALCWQDIDFEEQTLRINKTLTRGKKNKLIIQTPKTIKSKRKISLDDTTIEMMKKWRKEQLEINFKLGFNATQNSQLVFANSKNEWIAPSKVGQKYDCIVKRYKLKRITIHGFRHTHCSLLFEAGATVLMVQERLGHSDIQTTMNVYAHVSEKTKDSTAKLFAEYINK